MLLTSFVQVWRLQVIAMEQKHYVAYIEQLRTLLEEHLLLEDDFLYPVLKKRPDEGIRDLASRFSIELGNIKSAFVEYVGKWPSADSIVQSHSLFVSESKALLGALQNRIDREDNELFPLL